MVWKQACPQSHLNDADFHDVLHVILYNTGSTRFHIISLCLDGGEIRFQFTESSNEREGEKPRSILNTTGLLLTPHEKVASGSLSQPAFSGPHLNVYLELSRIKPKVRPSVRLNHT